MADRASAALPLRRGRRRAVRPRPVVAERGEVRNGLGFAPMPPSLESLIALPAGDISFLDRPDGARLRCLTVGSGSPVVFAHGFLGSMNNFNLVIPDLVKRGHRVVLFDHRGHGRSTAGRDGLST